MINIFFKSNTFSECIQKCSFVLYYENVSIVIQVDEDYTYYWLLTKGSGSDADEILSIAVGHNKPLIETPLALEIFQDEEILQERFYCEDFGVDLLKYDKELYDLEKSLSLTLEILEFEEKRREEISQLIHPELSKFWDYKFFELSKTIYNSGLTKNGTSQNIIDLFQEEMSLISQKKKMYFSCNKYPDKDKVVFYLNFPYLGNKDFSFRTRLCVEIVKNKILIIIEPNITERSLCINLDSYKESLEIIKELCDEDLTPLNQSVTQIIDKVWINYRNKEMALSTIELVLKQKGIKYELFPDNLSVRIDYFDQINRKSTSTRIYYREFNDNPEILYEIETPAKEGK